VNRDAESQKQINLDSIRNRKLKQTAVHIRLNLMLGTLAAICKLLNKTCLLFFFKYLQSTLCVKKINVQLVFNSLSTDELNLVFYLIVFARQAIRLKIILLALNFSNKYI